jgi:hypothetical protein
VGHTNWRITNVLGASEFKTPRKKKKRKKHRNRMNKSFASKNLKKKSWKPFSSSNPISSSFLVYFE